MIDSRYTASTTAVIECRGLWKIFGKRAAEAMRAIREQGLIHTADNLAAFLGSSIRDRTL